LIPANHLPYITIHLLIKEPHEGVRLRFPPAFRVLKTRALSRFCSFQLLQLPLHLAPLPSWTHLDWSMLVRSVTSPFGRGVALVLALEVLVVVLEVAVAEREVVELAVEVHVELEEDEGQDAEADEQDHVLLGEALDLARPRLVLLARRDLGRVPAGAPSTRPAIDHARMEASRGASERRTPLGAWP